MAASLLLGAVYLALSFAMDAHGYLGTDTGAKVATLEAMDRAGTADPDVGYWAETWDPTGQVHPFRGAEQTDDGAWVAVTTLPLLEAARPLYALGGYRAALLLPMLGAVAAAHAARQLARRVGDGDGWSAFWVTGAASPVLLYALDLWEHSLGVAAMVGATVLLLDAIQGRPAAVRALGAGALFGLAAALRTEAIVYALVVVGTACAVMAWQARQLVRSLVTGAASVAGFAALWFANRALEEAVGGISRAERATEAADRATSSAVSEVRDRVGEALVTLLGAKGDAPSSWLLGLAIVAVLAMAVRAQRRGDPRMATVVFVLAGAVYVVSAVGDLGFVPGLMPAFPIAIGVMVHRPSDRSGVVATMAVVALPLVWAFQYLGGAGPQWGGRYTLVSAVLLGVLALEALRDEVLLRRGLLALTALVTAIGLVWMGVRTRAVDDLFTDLAAVDADVLIARDAFLLREGGAVVLDEHWLTATGVDTYAVAVDVAERSGASTVAVVEPGATALPADAVPRGWQEVGHALLDLAGRPVAVVVFDVP